MTTSTLPEIADCPVKLSGSHVAQFQKDGFLAFENFLDSATVERLKSGMTSILAGLQAQARAGTATMKRGNWEMMRNYSGLLIKSGDESHAALLEPDVDMDAAIAPLPALENCIRKFTEPARANADFRALSENPTLIGMLEQLMGPKPILYGDQALCKPPRIGSEKPWHQDSAYFSYEPAEAGIDVWIALDDAAVENGCMHVLPGAHLLGPKKHIHRDDCTIADGRLDYSHALPVPLKAGGVLLFSVMLPHFTPPNRSDLRRRAVQLFYRAAHTRMIDEEQKVKSFVEADGTPASCAAAKRKG